MVYRNSGPAKIHISVPVPAGTDTIPLRIYASNEMLYVII